MDEVLRKMKPKIVLEAAGQKIEVGFESLDHFHPDALVERVELLGALLDTRQKIDDPRTYNIALKELRSPAGIEGAEPEHGSRERPGGPSGNILNEIIDGPGGGSAGRGGGMSGRADLAGFVNAVVKPYSVIAHDPAQDHLKEAFDGYISVFMAEILHHPAFQAMEAAWRGVHFLVSRAETDEDLEIRLLDISQEELAFDLLASDDLADTVAYRLLAGDPLTSPEARPWAVLVGDYTFDHEDAAVLGRMAKIAAAAGAPFIARAHPHLMGCGSSNDPARTDSWDYTPGAEAGQAWDALRRLPEAVWIGLTAPRFLLRLPYGRDTDETESFAFEEMPDEPVHEHYLWGNPAFACACLLADAFSREGWSMTPGVVNDIEGLPLHSMEVNGESRLTPCAEILLTDKAVEAILDRGIMPLATIRGTDSARLIRFQSLALPLAGLKGRWESSTH
jgi:type VI secretion system protein ImpC